jgi:hypothetical protein
MVLLFKLKILTDFFIFFDFYFLCLLDQVFGCAFFVVDDAMICSDGAYLERFLFSGGFNLFIRGFDIFSSEGEKRANWKMK